MKNRRHLSAALAAVILGAAALGSVGACGDSDNDPGVRMLSPNAGATVNLGADLKTRVVITANDLELKARGTCGSDSRCGVAYLIIDGNLCNQPGKPYNNLLGDGTLGQDFFIDALFEFCPANARAGTHLLTVSLHREDGTLVTGSGGQPAQATVSIVTTSN